MNVYEALGEIQARLKVPKSHRNEFGGYNYRNAEDILEAAKPLAHAVGCIVNCSDEILYIEGRWYVNATAILTDYDGNAVAAQGCAREEDVKKGMDASQITGKASSYARKYALNGLFAIDDVKDADSTQGAETPSKAPKQTRPRKGAPKGGNGAQTAPDALTQAKRELNAAIKAYAEREGLDAQGIAAGIAKRPEYETNKDDAEWYRQIMEEFK